MSCLVAILAMTEFSISQGCVLAPGSRGAPREREPRDSEPAYRSLGMGRAAAMTPRPETNLLICHGVLASRARWRERVVAYGRVLPEPTAAAPPRP